MSRPAGNVRKGCLVSVGRADDAAVGRFDAVPRCPGSLPLLHARSDVHDTGDRLRVDEPGEVCRIGGPPETRHCRPAAEGRGEVSDLAGAEVRPARPPCHASLVPSVRASGPTIGPAGPAGRAGGSPVRWHRSRPGCRPADRKATDACPMARSVSSGPVIDDGTSKIRLGIAPSGTSSSAGANVRAARRPATRDHRRSRPERARRPTSPAGRADGELDPGPTASDRSRAGMRHRRAARVRRAES